MALILVWEHKVAKSHHQVWENPKTKEYKYKLTANGNIIVNTEMYERKGGVVKAIRDIEKAYLAGNTVSESYKSTIKKRAAK
jgi:uncharacterized protein YegP (UPF0339 family)